MGLFYETEARKVFCEVELESKREGPEWALYVGCVVGSPLCVYAQVDCR